MNDEDGEVQQFIPEGSSILDQRKGHGAWNHPSWIGASILIRESTLQEGEKGDYNEIKRTLTALSPA